MRHHRHTNALNSRATGTVIDWKVGMSAAEQSVTVKADAPFTFKWSGSHNVYRFPSEAAYKSCDFSRATFVSDKEFTMTLRGSGTVYFGCKVGSHCKLGQKVAVTIAGTLTARPTRPVDTTPPARTTTAIKGAATAHKLCILCLHATGLLCALVFFCPPLSSYWFRCRGGKLHSRFVYPPPQYPFVRHC